MKSQYTDNITGDVIVDIRARNDTKASILNLSDYKYQYILTKDKIGYDESNQIFNNGSLVLDTTNNYSTSMSILNINKTAATNFTVSYWQKSSYGNCAHGYGNYVETQIGTANFGTVFEVPGLENGAAGKTVYKYIRIYSSGNGVHDAYSYAVSDDMDSYWDSLTNTWIHIAIVKQNSDYKIYVNGELKFTRSLNNMNNNLSGNNLSYMNFVVADYYQNKKSYFDDIIFINGQALWTSNFTPPDYYLTGDHDLPIKFSKKNIIYPVQTDRNDYFDKAFIY